MTDAPTVAPVTPASAAEASDVRLIVGLRPGTRAAEADSAHQRAGATRVARIPQLGAEVVTVSAAQRDVSLASYQQEGRVTYAEVDHRAAATEVPNDPGAGSQWGLSKSGAYWAWDVTQGSPAVKIAVLDSGADLGHPDIATKIAGSANFTSLSAGSCPLNPAAVADVYGHGTHVAGIAAAATGNGVGVAGVGRNSSLLIGKVLADDGLGYYSWIACGITWAADSGAKVINLSLGATYPSTLLENAVNYAAGKGVVVVAAAGNSGSTTQFYPAAYGNVIAVGSTNTSDQLSSFSNRGGWVSLVAPGESIYATLPRNPNSMGSSNYGWLSGTSMASPHVAGVAALVWAAGATSAAQVRSILLSTADATPGTNVTFSNGRLNSHRAVLAAKALQPPAPPPPSGTPSPAQAGRSASVSSNGSGPVLAAPSPRR
ncbi:MAG: S8 family serine peptidase [Chloroflexota bacterium]